MFARQLLRITVALLLSAAVSASGFGQGTTPAIPPTPKAPSNTGNIILVVTGVSLFGILVYTLRHQKRNDTRNLPSFVGCTDVKDYGAVITDERDAQEYVLLPGPVTVKTGERVQVLARKDEDAAGRLALRVGKVVKDFGPCKPATAPAAPPKTP